MSQKKEDRIRLTEHDEMMIMELVRWKENEIARINSIASIPAIAEKFGISASGMEKAIARFKKRAA